jgi:GDPmannose 4,6-dehydratase
MPGQATKSRLSGTFDMAYDPAMPRALITGVGGQDGSLLAELLLEEGTEVVGICRRPPDEYPNLDALRGRIELVQADLLDQPSIVGALRRAAPDEVYNLASVSFVPASWREPVQTAEFAAVGATALLEAIRQVDPGMRYYQASSSEIFGEPADVPQNERTPLAPVTPYGVAKAYAHFITRSYRHRYDMYACSGILYNHESPRRTLEFVTRKIAHGAASIALGLERELRLGSLDARRDWGYAGDYVAAMRLMMRRDEPGDYIIASGVLHSVQDLAELAFAHVGLDWRDYVRVDDTLQRGRAELHDLVGDATKARTELGWAPSVTFEELVRMLVDADLAALEATGIQTRRS